MNELITLPYLAAGVLVPPVSLLLLALLGLLLMRRRRWLGVAVAGVSLTALLALSLPALAMLLMDQIEPAPLPNSRATAGAGTIVILAGGITFSAPEWGGQTVSTATLQRVRYGAALARETRLPILVSGSDTRPGSPGEAVLMRNLLRDEFGLPPRWVEGESRDTAGNATLSARMLAAERIGTVVLVTSAFHMPRAQRVFEKAGLRVIAAPTGYFGRAGSPLNWRHLVPSGTALYVSFVALREMGGQLTYRILGRD